MPFKRMHAMAYTVQLHCPISAAIRTADSQSDLISYPRMINTVGATNVEQILKPNPKNLFKLYC